MMDMESRAAHGLHLSQSSRERATVSKHCVSSNANRDNNNDDDEQEDALFRKLYEQGIKDSRKRNAIADSAIPKFYNKVSL